MEIETLISRVSLILAMSVFLVEGVLFGIFILRGTGKKAQAEFARNASTVSTLN